MSRQSADLGRKDGRQAGQGGQGGERQTKKELEVLDVAAEYFLNDGYQGASINAMARDSGISKESIYRYFSSKKALFEAVIAKELEEYRARLDFFDLEYESMPLAAALQQVGESILQAISNDRVLKLRRLVFQEAAQSPEIGQLYYEVGPQAAYHYLEKIFASHENPSGLEPAQLAYHYVALLLHRLMLQRECRVIDAPPRDEIAEHVSTITDEFLRLYLAPR